MMDAPAERSVPHRHTGTPLLMRALAAEIDATHDAAARDALLRAVGRRMARLRPLPEVASMEALEIELNEALAALDWGAVQLVLEADAQRLTLLHAGLPRLGGAGDPPGTWLSAALEGLYETWIGQQPGSDATLVARRHGSVTTSLVTLLYSKGWPRNERPPHPATGA